MTVPPLDALPPLVFDYDGHWLNVDLSLTPEAWATGAADLLLGAGGGRRGKRAQRGLAEHLNAVVAAAARRQDFTVLLLLCPGPEFLVKAAVRLVAVEIEGADDLGELGPLATAYQMVNPEGAELAEPAEVSELTTPAGPAARGRLRLVLDQPGRPVHEVLSYAWVLPGYRYGAMLTTAFADLVEAGRWRPLIDALAAAASLEAPADAVP